VKKDAGNVSLLGSPQVQVILEQDDQISGVSADVLNDGSSYMARLMVTGKSTSETISWYASVKEFVVNYD
jgi:hypothetical protein